jgi:MoxR-like ATPase
MATNNIGDTIHALIAHMEKVVIGRTETLRQILCCWVAGGHVLLEDMPGTGKTIMSRALARSFNSQFKRIQFTPDLLPNDVLGFSLLDQKTGNFKFVEGPVFSSILLADEINRATPRTQSSLLEAMGERQVSIEGKTYPLSPTFFVLATQNPVDNQGTFPLPEAQLDRFMMKLNLGYIQPELEIQMVKNQNLNQHPIETLQPIQDDAIILKLRELLPQVKVTDDVYQYAMKLMQMTRTHPELKTGGSPRAFLSLMRCAQAMALLEGKNFVSPSQIFRLAIPVLHHRISLTGEAKVRGRTTIDVLNSILEKNKVPVKMAS